MGMQSNLNQLLTLAAGAARLGPKYESVQAHKNLAKQEKVVSTISASLKDINALSGEFAEEYADVMEDRAEAAEKLFRTDPTEKTYKKARLAQSEARASRTLAVTEKGVIDEDAALQEQWELEQEAKQSPKLQEHQRAMQNQQLSLDLEQSRLRNSRNVLYENKNVSYTQDNTGKIHIEPKGGKYVNNK